MTSIIVKQLPKSGTLETFNVYILNTPVFYAKVHDVKFKYQSTTDKEYSLTSFVDEETKDKLLDEVMLNKTFAQVGKDKTSKAPRRIKFPLSSQVEEGKTNYDVVDGLFGFTVAKPEFSKAGNKMSVNVIDKDGEAFTQDIGNGSVCTLKLFGYKNVEGQLTVTLDTVQVIEHVPYESKGGDGNIEDDVLGSYKVKKAEVKAEEETPTVAPKKANPVPQKNDVDTSFEQDLPFNRISDRLLMII
jgi:hypothetical protein